MLLNNEINDIIKEEVDKLISDMKKRNGSGDLSNSIKADLEDGSAQILMDDYGVYVDKGVSGKNSPNFKGKRKTVYKSLDGYKYGSNNFRGTGKEWEKKIGKWMAKKNIGGLDKKATNFLIRRSIYQHGSKGTLFASKAYDDFNEELNERLSNIDFKNIIKHN